MFWGMLGSTALCACASVKIIGASGVGHSQNKDLDDCVLAVGAYMVIERLVFMKSYIIHDQMIDRYLIIVYELLHREKISDMSYS